MSAGVFEALKLLLPGCPKAMGTVRKAMAVQMRAAGLETTIFIEWPRHLPSIGRIPADRRFHPLLPGSWSACA